MTNILITYDITLHVSEILMSTLNTLATDTYILHNDPSRKQVKWSIVQQHCQPYCSEDR